MGIYSDALDRASKRLRENSLFLYKTILVDGKRHEPLICEKRMLRVLEFKGTGPKMKFFDIYRIVDDLLGDELERAWDLGDLKHTPWIDEYVIQNNIQVVFEKDDVKVNPRRARV